MDSIRLVHISDIHITVPRFRWFREDWFNKRLPAWFNLRWLGRGKRFANAERVLIALVEELRRQPPDRVVFGWHLGPEWKYDPDEARSTEVEVRFIAEGPTTTRVELEHRGFEVHGERADELRTPVAAEGGWSGLLDRFAKAV